MPVEVASYINQLDAEAPAGPEPFAEGDDHLRLIKDVLTRSLPNVGGVVTATHGQLNLLSAVNTQNALVHTGGGQTIAGNLAATSFTEGGTALASKYLGINAKAADSEKLDNIDSSGFARAGARTDNYGWFRRSSTSSPLYVTQQSTGPIAAFLQGSGDGTEKSRINNDGSFSGNAATATKLLTARTVSLTGDVTGSASFDGTSNISITATVGDSSHNHSAENITSGTLNAARLPFTPVQQGGGSGQGTNKIYIGWGTSSDLRLQVDSTSFGNVWPIDISGNAASATNADKLDNISSGSFMRSDANDTKTAGYSRFNDSILLQFGNSADGEIFHSGSHQYLDINTGDFYIRSGTTTKYLFDVSSGNFHADGHVYWQSGSVGSDPKLKKNERVIDNPLERVRMLNGYFFEWKSGKKGLTGGLMSNEIRKALPGTVHKTGGLSRKKYDQFDYNCATGLLVEAVKVLDERLKKGGL